MTTVISKKAEGTRYLLKCFFSKRYLVPFGFLFFLAFTSGAFAAEKIKIVTTTSTFASLAGEVTGETAEIYSVASPNQSIHFIAPTPKDVLKTKKADVFIHGGLDLETWRDPLLQAAGRKEFFTGERSIDASSGITLINAPGHDHPVDGSLSRLHGDIHAFGNPHYWPDPENARRIVDTLAAKLAELYPDHKDEFLARAENFKNRLNAKIENWQTRLAPYRGTKVVTYHNSWPYFLRFCGMEVLDFLEPKPGIPPTAKHLSHIIEEMRAANVKVIVREVYEEKQTPEKVAQATGAAVVTLYMEAGQVKGRYIDLMEANVAALEKAHAYGDESAKA